MLGTGGNSTTIQSLMHIIRHTKPYFQGLPGYETSIVGFNRSVVDVDEVFPNVLIGNLGAAQNINYLQYLNVTHVLNAAEGNFQGMAPTNQGNCNAAGIFYMGLPIIDMPTFEIHEYFQMAANFIEQSVRNGGKVLVHCVRGRSRSSTLVIAYLMIKMNMPAAMALRLCCQRHTVNPNLGFLQRLIDLENY